MEGFKFGVYRHTKSGNYYHCYDAQLDSENIKSLRISYLALYGEGLKFSRPAEMFEEIVVINGAEHQRFTYVCPWEEWNPKPTDNG